MKLIFLTAPRLLAAATFLGLGAIGADAAEWGSLRGNNHAPPPSGVHVPPPPSGSHVTRPAERMPPRTVPAPHETRVRSEPVPTPTGRQNDAEARHAREIERGHDFERVIRERRHLDLDGDRRHAFHWARFYPGMFIDVLPVGYVPIYVGGNIYYYYDGVYYEPTPSGYEVIAPPIGAIVPALPPGAETIVAGGMVYYYAAGTFYAPHPNGYRVVPAPLGVTVSSLPPDAVRITVNGRLYFQARGVYYQPVMQDGVTVYVITQPPLS